MLLAAYAFVIGGWIRLSAPLAAGFPINDGGLFHAAIYAVQANHFLLPEYLNFSGMTIPFAYPPLGFYVGAFLSNVLKITPLAVLQWLPAVIATICIPAFYRLAKVIMEDDLTAGLATVFYAFIPIAHHWAIMGGGLTRSLGLLFLLLGLGSSYQLFSSAKKKYLPFVILFNAPAVLSHPEAALNLAFFTLAIFLYKGWNKNGIALGIFSAAGILLLTSPWWATVLMRFGEEPFLAASGSSPRTLFAAFFPFFLSATREPQISFIAALGMMGFFISLWQKKTLLPVLFLLPYFIHLRSADVYSVISMAMLAALSFSEIVLPVFQKLPSHKWFASASVIYLAIYLPVNLSVYQSQVISTTVPESDRQAFAWIHANTPPGARFLVLTGEPNGYCDGISEWFPALTERINAGVVQGNEWIPGRLEHAIEVNTGLQGCVMGDAPVACLEKITEENSIQYDYVYLSRRVALKPACLATANISIGERLVQALASSIVYDQDDVTIFRHQP